MQALFEKYELPYVTGPLPKQVASAWHKVFRLSLPNPVGARAPGRRSESGPVRRPSSRGVRRRLIRTYLG